jgi:hypothetical protein
MKHKPLLFSVLWAVLLVACGSVGVRPAPSDKSLGMVEVTFSGVGAEFTASARVWTPELRTQASSDVPGGLQLSLLSRNTFDVGRRGADGTRFLSATFRVRNADANGVGYAVDHENLTFVAVNTPNTLQGSAVRGLERFDGSSADPNLVSSIAPTHAMTFDHAKRLPRVIPEAADFQVFDEAEVAALGALDGVTSVLPYGFVVRCVTNCTPGSRRLRANPAPDQFDGQITFAVKLPLQASANDDPFRFSMLFQVVLEDERRVTQSLEELDDTGVGARAIALGTERIMVMPGSVFFDAKKHCAVRTAGTAANPSAFLVNLASLTSAPRLSLPPGAPITLGFDRDPLGTASLRVTGSMTGRKAGTVTARPGELLFTPDPLESYPLGETLEVELGSDLRFVNASGLCDEALWRLRTRGSTPSEASFEPEVRVPGLTAGYGVVLADVNDDRQIDAVVGSNSNGIAVLLGNGDGSFRTPVNYLVGGLPFFVTVTDLTGDGHLDIVAIQGGSGSLAILTNRGDGRFTLTSPFPVGDSPVSVIPWDFDEDGRVDLLVGGGAPTGRLLGVFLGNGDGSFRADPNPRFAPREVRSMVKADINGDRKMDLVTLEASSLTVHLNRGDGQFFEKTVSSLPFLAQTLGSADLDADGFEDLVVAGRVFTGSEESALVLFGSRDVSLHRGFRLDVPDRSDFFAVLTADVNGDDHLDIALGGFSSREISLFLGEGRGRFQPRRIVSGPGSVSLGAADLNGDAKLDLVTTNLSRNAFVLLQK